CYCSVALPSQKVLIETEQAQAAYLFSKAMKAAVCKRYGPPQVLEVREVDKPICRGGEVLVRVQSAAVTWSDCFIRHGVPSARLPIRIIFQREDCSHCISCEWQTPARATGC